jgi:RNA polymerase sigma-70 factor (ECF subfamily)
LEAARPDSPGGSQAFAQLYRDYWYPLYAYVRRRGRSPHEAEDLTQDFFVSLLERRRLAGLDRTGGRFRSFLLKSLQNFLANAWDHAAAQKRGGGQVSLPLDEVDAESKLLADSAVVTPEAAFERHWALALLELALRQLEAELQAAGKAIRFRPLFPHLQGDRNGRPYAEIAEALGLSESGVKVAVYRLRRRYGELLRVEVARTVDTEVDVEDELRHLIEVVSS